MRQLLTILQLQETKLADLALEDAKEREEVLVSRIIMSPSCRNDWSVLLTSQAFTVGAIPFGKLHLPCKSEQSCTESLDCAVALLGAGARS